MLKLVGFAVAAMSLSVSAQTTAQLSKKLDSLTEEVAKLKSQKSVSMDKLHIGGYGELTWTKKEKGEDNSASSNPVFDNKRFILYVGYDFSEKWSLRSEIEVEHANEIYMEQAYLQYAHSDTLGFRFGTLLVPMGHQNPYHEPTSFFGVQRTETESRIIPSTWRENGAGVYGKMGKFSYEAYYIVSLNAAKFDASGVRGGRTRASKSDAGEGSIVARLDYDVMSNVQVGASFYTGKANDASSTPNNLDYDVKHNVYEVHYKGTFGALHTRALFAEATVSNADKLSATNGKTVADKMGGYYAEVGYDVNYGKQWQLIPFVRYEAINTQKEVDSSLTEDKSKDRKLTTIGFVAKPMENISLKIDYTQEKNEAESGVNAWNIGAGWNF